LYISEIKASHFDRRAGISSGDYQDVIVRFNGLVYSTGTNNANPPLKLELIRLLGGTVFYDLIEPDKYRVEVQGTATAPKREVKIHGLASYKVSAGAYRVSVRTQGTGDFYPILCAGSETGITPPQVSPFQFWFHLDAPDHATPGGDCECECWCADFNQDGGITGDDIGPFLDAWSTGDSSADVNGCDGLGDGGIDGADLERFITCWEAGSPC